jgi:hypothetical protein
MPLDSATNLSSHLSALREVLAYSLVDRRLDTFRATLLSL